MLNAAYPNPHSDDSDYWYNIFSATIASLGGAIGDVFQFRFTDNETGTVLYTDPVLVTRKMIAGSGSLAITAGAIM